MGNILRLSFPRRPGIQDETASLVDSCIRGNDEQVIRVLLEQQLVSELGRLSSRATLSSTADNGRRQRCAEPLRSMDPPVV